MEENILRKQNKVNDENNGLMLKRNIHNCVVESWPILNYTVFVKRLQLFREFEEQYF